MTSFSNCRSQANRGLAEYQQIRRVLRWPELQFPYTSTGKLLRRNVAEWACATLLSRQQVRGSVGLPGGDALLRMIAEITGESVAGANTELRLSEDLHLDSLGRVQLQSALEQGLGVELEDEAIAGARTLGDLRELLELEGGHGCFVSAGGRRCADRCCVGESGRSAGGISAQHGRERGKRMNKVSALAVELADSRDSGCFCQLVMRPLVWLLAAPRVVRETEELPHGPVLVIANHVTAYDGALILYALPVRLRRRIAIAMSGEMLLDLRVDEISRAHCRTCWRLSGTGW